MKSALPRRLLSSVALGILSTGAACSKPAPTPERDLAPSSATPLAPTAGPSAIAAPGEPPPPENTIPTLAPEPFAGIHGTPVDFYPIDGALLVVEGLRVGRIVGEGVEWFGALPETNAHLGGSQINAVHGNWPDAVDVFYSSNSGRASQPSIYPLTGKGTAVTFSAGGGEGWISGTTRLGKTTIAGGYDMFDGYHFKTVRGPGLVLKAITAEKAGCKEGEVQRPFKNRDGAVAVPFTALAATEKGTLVTVGNLCGREGTPVAEVWDQPGKSRIVELGAWLKRLDAYPGILAGKGDDLWLVSNPVLHYSGGKFEPLPALDRPLKSAFVSPEGKLYGLAGRSIYRHDDGKWTVVANLPWPMWFSMIAMDEKGTIWVSHDGISRLREQSADLERDCKTPFVYLYGVSWKNEPRYSFPTTRKALSTFPEVGDISLVEYWEGGRTLGVKVKSKEQGEAVIAHLRTTMKDEHPEMICHAPKKPRIIEIVPGK